MRRAASCDQKVPGSAGRRGVLVIPIRVCAAQRGRDFGIPDLKRGIHIQDVF